MTIIQQIQIEGHPSLCEQEINLQNENKRWLSTVLFDSLLPAHLISLISVGMLTQCEVMEIMLIEVYITIYEHITQAQF